MSDKVIRFPGAAGRPDDEDERPPTADRVSGGGSGEFGIPGLTSDQEKALRIVLSGMSFVCVGIKPAGDGADFFTAIDGVRSELQEAEEHLPGVIDRAYRRHGM